MLKNKEINLDLPIDAYDAEGNPRKKEAESISDDSSTEVSQTEEKKEEITPEEKEEVVEEQRVPYSRFDKIRREKEEALAREAETRKLYEESLLREKEPVKSMDLDAYEEEYARDIKKLYGDTDVAKEIIEINMRHQRAIEERAERKALEAIERKQYEESRAIAQNENIIEDRLYQLSDRLGRPLSETEEEALLEIVDEYTPTGPDGRYAGEILSFEKAWEIHELRQSQRAQTSRKSRSAALAASSSKSQGEPHAETEERNKNFDPRNWNSLWDRIGRQ